MNAKNTNKKSKRGRRRFTQKRADGAEQLANSNWQLAKVKTGDLTAKDAEGAEGEERWPRMNVNSANR